MYKQKLNSRDILDKEFKKNKLGGYKIKEVDLFLDMIMDDYEYFTQNIKALKDANAALRKENFDIKVGLLRSNKQTIVEKEMLTKDLENIGQHQKDLILEEIDNSNNKINILKAELEALKK